MLLMLWGSEFATATRGDVSVALLQRLICENMQLVSAKEELSERNRELLVEAHELRRTSKEWRVRYEHVCGAMQSYQHIFDRAWYASAS